MTESLAAKGLRPEVIIGHSVGEVPAAYVAGCLSLEDAVRVSHHRGRLQETTDGQGGMLAVGVDAKDVPRLLEGLEGEVSIAAINSPGGCTLAGKKEALQEVAARLEAEGTFNRFLRVGVPYHSHVMEPLKAELFNCLEGLSPKAPQLPLYSTALGQEITEAVHDAACSTSSNSR